ncbi:MAG: hypothetical protein G01um101420_968 [Parcubacteria group bacterium Gr01-1014_20]|nr:MAG: hypothetical protein G01um101420_968 [Parcubacteria group bacterium Gr01-1014_20]
MSKTATRKCVYLLVGQRGSGKSSYAKRLLANQPELLLISRDEILVHKFGSTDTNPYGGAQWYVLEIMHRFLRFVLRTRPMAKIILDCWTEDSKDRASLVQKLREYGATRVTALYFVTSREVVNSWFWLKPGIAKMEEMGKHDGENLVYFSADAPSRDYDTFHRLARHINSDGFDQVIRIDPRTEPIMLG